MCHAPFTLGSLLWQVARQMASNAALAVLLKHQGQLLQLLTLGYERGELTWMQVRSLSAGGIYCLGCLLPRWQPIHKVMASAATAAAAAASSAGPWDYQVCSELLAQELPYFPTTGTWAAWGHNTRDVGCPISPFHMPRPCIYLAPKAGRPTRNT